MIFDIEPFNNFNRKVHEKQLVRIVKEKLRIKTEKKFDYEKYLVEELGWEKLPNETFRITYSTVHHNGFYPSERDVYVDFCNLTEEDKTVEETFKYILERDELMAITVLTFKVNENGELI